MVIVKRVHLIHISHKLTTGAKKPNYGGRNKHSHGQTMMQKCWLNGNAGTLGKTMVIKLVNAVKVTGNKNVVNLDKNLSRMYNIKI